MTIKAFSSTFTKPSNTLSQSLFPSSMEQQLTLVLLATPKGANFDEQTLDYASSSSSSSAPSSTSSFTRTFLKFSVYFSLVALAYYFIISSFTVPPPIFIALDSPPVSPSGNGTILVPQALPSNWVSRISVEVSKFIEKDSTLVFTMCVCVCSFVAKVWSFQWGLDTWSGGSSLHQSLMSSHSGFSELYVKRTPWCQLSLLEMEASWLWPP